MRPDPFILGLVGQAGVGKDTAAEYLVEHYGFARFAFADPLREMLFSLLEICGIDHVWITEPHLKEQPIPGLGVSYRQLAQTLGTEWGRRQIAPDLWLRTASLALGFNAAVLDTAAPVRQRIVISDVRFLNEAEWILALGGTTARILRQVPPVREHVSEQFVDEIPTPAILSNSGGLAYLYHQLDRLMASHGIAARAPAGELVTSQEC